MWNEKFTKIIKDKLVYVPNLEQKLVWSPIPLLCCVCEGDSVNFLLQVFILRVSFFSTQNFPFFYASTKAS
jgi:hypothetical protein